MAGECGDKSTATSFLWGVECEAVSLYRRQFERSFRQFVSDRVPGTQFESSQVHHAFTREPGFPEIRQLAPNWRGSRASALSLQRRN